MNRGLVAKTFFPIALAVGLLSTSFDHAATLRAAPEVTVTPLVPVTTRDGRKDFQFSLCSNGVGIFDTYYTYRGIATIARYRWSRKDGQPHFEQLYSKNNGKTWELNWVSDYTRD